MTIFVLFWILWVCRTDSLSGRMINQTHEGMGLGRWGILDWAKHKWLLRIGFSHPRCPVERIPPSYMVEENAWVVAGCDLQWRLERRGWNCRLTIQTGLKRKRGFGSNGGDGQRPGRLLHSFFQFDVWSLRPTPDRLVLVRCLSPSPLLPRKWFDLVEGFSWPAWDLPARTRERKYYNKTESKYAAPK